MIMKILKAYQFRLYPTKEQEVFIRKTFGCSCQKKIAEVYRKLRNDSKIY